MSLPPLPTFSEYFRAVHGYEPYPWQQRLALMVVQEGTWPKTIGVPTGTGKTATLDVAIYALAASASQAPQERRAPRRIIMVVDRRTIVDQSFARAQVLRDRLANATQGPLDAVRQRLVALMGGYTKGEEPLQVALLRGGVPRDDGWARRPDQALIGVSTVDQVGSRLLFRGYGVRPTMQSVHAGLLGSDTLFLLDEVHLSRPFEQTLAALANKWRSWREASFPDRWQVVSLSATSSDAEPFSLSDEDRAHVRLKVRLQASKPVTCQQESCNTHGRSGPTSAWIKALVKGAKEQLKGGASCVGVVVNRVDTARLVAKALSSKSVDVQLVTGRMRGVDRVAATQALEERAGPAWTKGERPFVCVATQSIEAGADLDFDAMVTEVASLDALVQRFGRVNRSGRHSQAPILVVAPKGLESLEDPIYGRALGVTWAWLQEQGPELNASPQILESLLAAAPLKALAPKPDAAVLLPAHLDLLSQTSPVPMPDPDPALYLHGLEPPRADVTVLWRADLLSCEREMADQHASLRLQAVPPSSFEGLSLPFAVAKRWLAGEVETSFGDAGSIPDDARDVGRSRNKKVAYRWDGASAKAIPARSIRPGDTLVVPAARGGLALGGFDPIARDLVQDHGDLAYTLRTGRPIVRLDLSVYGELVETEGTSSYRWPDDIGAPPAIPDLELTTVQQAAKLVHQWLLGLSLNIDQGSRLARQIALVASSSPRVSILGGRWVISGRKPLSTEVLLALGNGQSALPSDEARTADNASIVSLEPVGLSKHLAGVAAWAGSFAEACGLPQPISEDLTLAGRLHDLGKADPRFQALLHGGDEITALGAPEPLAKSSGILADREARRAARERSGLPRGFRHEMMSVAMILTSAEGEKILSSAHDPELVLHLVASHHGYARPYAPPEEHWSTAPNEGFSTGVLDVELTGPPDHGLDAPDSGVADRFWVLQERYGWWGLAWLESILRLADHRESEYEERQVFLGGEA
ncbi:MAG: type I-U CRISPR-associated helicase/endonuclease Cas3 [Deltaproteobacteria bacterium]|nr:MAG: type I-U CRISPR-associated helicase/endonuclease Cas3 [Deltaproteobacteria bacterium]